MGRSRNNLVIQKLILCVNDFITIEQRYMNIYDIFVILHFFLFSAKGKEQHKNNRKKLSDEVKTLFNDKFCKYILILFIIVFFCFVFFFQTNLIS